MAGVVNLRGRGGPSFAGPFSRAGSSRQGEKACDHDFAPDGGLVRQDRSDAANGMIIFPPP
jgi:hypothetical protein